MALACASAGCVDGNGETGGEARFDAAPPAAPVPCEEAGADAGSGTAWGDLYRDYFGPSGKASCAGNGQCHGASSEQGAQSSNFVCPGTAAGCYQGITSTSAGLVTPGDTTTDPTTTTLYLTLRKECNLGGVMPKSPADVYFTPSDLNRITAWIKAGAPND